MRVVARFSGAPAKRRGTSAPGFGFKVALGCLTTSYSLCLQLKTVPPPKTVSRVDGNPHEASEPGVPMRVARRRNTPVERVRMARKAIPSLGGCGSCTVPTFFS
jgi:hypothetical protein